MTTIEVRPGLRDVIAGDTHICRLDEQHSRIYIYGYQMEELVEKNSFEEVAYLTLFGDLPTKGYRFDPPAEAMLRATWATLRTEPKGAHPMGLLRTAMSSFGNQVDVRDGAVAEGLSAEQERQRSLELVAATGHLVAQVARHYDGKSRPEPPSGLGHAATVLGMMRGRRPNEFEAQCMDVALILYTEHEINAGSFATRVAASAHSDLYSSAIAGECVLRGPRHGCANEEVMKILLDQGGDADKARQYLDRFFSQPGARLPGFGHAVYNLPQSYDPRVNVLRPLVKELSRRKKDMRWYETLLAFEEFMAERMKPRVAAGNPNAPANMDLWTAPLYYLLGIPIPLYTPLFAASRIAGWAAHYLETRYVNDEPIIRPRADYVGPEVHSFEPSANHSRW